MNDDGISDTQITAYLPGTLELKLEGERSVVNDLFKVPGKVEVADLELWLLCFVLVDGHVHVKRASVTVETGVLLDCKRMTELELQFS